VFGKVSRWHLVTASLFLGLHRLLDNLSHRTKLQHSSRTDAATGRLIFVYAPWGYGNDSRQTGPLSS
jgi:hypothetical protein